MAETPKTRAPRTFQCAPVIVFDEALKTLQLSERALCFALGYSGNASYDWRKTGQMPLVAAELCRAKIALQQRHSTDIVLLVRVPQTGHSRELLEHLAKSLGLEFVAV